MREKAKEKCLELWKKLQDDQPTKMVTEGPNLLCEIAGYTDVYDFDHVAWFGVRAIVHVHRDTTSEEPTVVVTTIGDEACCSEFKELLKVVEWQLQMAEKMLANGLPQGFSDSERYELCAALEVWHCVITIKELVNQSVRNEYWNQCATLNDGSQWRKMTHEEFDKEATKRAPYKE